jgi:hypothetical protein
VKNLAKKQDSKKVVDIGSRLHNIKTLYMTRRLKEAIAYMYMLYIQLCGTKWGEKRVPSQSISDFAKVMVKKYGQNPMTVYPFVQNVESIIYGGKQPSPEAFEKATNLFGNVFLEIVGKPLPQLV